MTKRSARANGLERAETELPLDTSTAEDVATSRATGPRPGDGDDEGDGRLVVVTLAPEVLSSTGDAKNSRTPRSSASMTMRQVIHTHTQAGRGRTI
jgi:hypothetical protein